jgi:hypothetical protein
MKAANIQVEVTTQLNKDPHMPVQLRKPKYVRALGKPSTDFYISQPHGFFEVWDALPVAKNLIQVS